MRYPSLFNRAAATFAVASGFALLPQEAKAIQFDISSIPGSEIIFSGTGGFADITFSGGDNFQIDGVVGGTGSATGYVGSFSGTWTMGPVTTVTLVPLVETAPVSGTGTLKISDGVNDLTATVAWVEASSLKTVISIATIGVTGNVTGVSYAGSDPDLLAFAAGLDK